MMFHDCMPLQTHMTLILQGDNMTEEKTGQIDPIRDPFEAKRIIDRADATILNKRDYLEHREDIDPRLPENPRRHFGEGVWDNQVGGWLGFLGKLGPDPTGLPS
jgi:hypothetical protein